MRARRRYVSAEEYSGRWDGFAFRAGDIVISSRSKHGTTWLQMVTLLLVHQTPELPAPLGELSPWLDHLVEPPDPVIARLVAQPHRRVIKTHTPLTASRSTRGSRIWSSPAIRSTLPWALYHQAANIDRDRLRRLTGAEPSATAGSRPLLRECCSPSAAGVYRPAVAARVRSDVRARPIAGARGEAVSGPRLIVRARSARATRRPCGMEYGPRTVLCQQVPRPNHRRRKLLESSLPRSG